MDKANIYKLISILLIITVSFLYVHQVQAGGVVKVIAKVVKTVVDVVVKAAPYIIGAVIGLATGGLAFGLMAAFIGAGIGVATVGVIDYTTCWINVLWNDCENGGGGSSIGSAVLQVDVQVNGSDGPVTFIVPATFNVEWSTIAAKSCAATGDWEGDIPGRSGTSKISNLGIGDYNYGVKCVNENNKEASDNVIVYVVGPEVDLFGPSTVEIPDPLTLNWTSSNVSSCLASVEWNGSKPFSGPETIWSSTQASQRGDHTFTLTCSDNFGNSDSDSHTATIIQVPRCSFTANPSTIILPESSILEWSCQYADSCSISQGIGSVDSISGTKEVRPTETTTFILACQGLDGEKYWTATVSVEESGLFRWREIIPR
ncbi:MAG: hypothetical protein V3T98_00940 [Candidatus Paceibacterota bacterium]